MSIEIGNKPEGIPFGDPKRGPHFYRIHDNHVRETNEGEEVYEIPTDLIIGYMRLHKDDAEVLDTVVCILANAGVSVNLTALHNGETDAAVLLARQADHSWHQDGKLQYFLGFSPLAMSRQLGYHYLRIDSPKNPDDAAAAQRSHDTLLSFLKDLGLEPNRARLQAEFCRECRQ